MAVKCKIQWVCKESGWKATPDQNDAVALAFMSEASDKTPIPICADHLAFAKREQLTKGDWLFIPVIDM